MVVEAAAAPGAAGAAMERVRARDLASTACPSCLGGSTGHGAARAAERAGAPRFRLGRFRSRAEGSPPLLEAGGRGAVGHRPGERGGSIELAYAGLEIGLQVGDFLGNLLLHYFTNHTRSDDNTSRRREFDTFSYYLPARVCVAWPPGGDFSVTSVDPSNYPATRRG